MMQEWEGKEGYCDFCHERKGDVVGLGEKSENYTDNSDVLGMCRACWLKREGRV